MAFTYVTSWRRTFWPWLAIGLVLAITTILLHRQGRLWTCPCGYSLLWAGNIEGSDNSQHFFDPYSFAHVLHGLIFYGALAWTAPWLEFGWRLTLAVVVESLWEIVENSSLVIQRYREATLALAYEGDTIVNAHADILCCIIGFLLAGWLGFRRSLIMFVVIEIVLVLWIRDSLILSIVMLLHPIEAIKAWQIGQ